MTPRQINATPALMPKIMDKANDNTKSNWIEGISGRGANQL